MVSWRNPGADDRDMTLDDYRTAGRAGGDRGGHRHRRRRQGARGRLLPGRHAAGHHRRRDGARRRRADHVAELLAAQTDFTEAGELMLFIDESQLAFLEDMMWQKGFLESKQMAGVFQALRSNDLIWSRHVHDYLMGERSTGIDIMAWNADATRMPYRMHSRVSALAVSQQRSRRGPLQGRGPAGVGARICAFRCSRSAPSRITSRRGARSTRSICTPTPRSPSR